MTIRISIEVVGLGIFENIYLGFSKDFKLFWGRCFIKWNDERRYVMIKRLIYLVKRFFEKDLIFFIGSADKLPAPLSKEDEIKYVTLSMNGDSKARSKLIEHNLRLVVFLAKNMKIQGLIWKIWLVLAVLD